MQPWPGMPWQIIGTQEKIAPRHSHTPRHVAPRHPIGHPQLGTMDRPTVHGMRVAHSVWVRQHHAPLIAGLVVALSSAHSPPFNQWDDFSSLRGAWRFLIDWWPPKAWSPPLLFSIFCCSMCRPERRDNPPPPHTFRPGRISFQTPPPTVDADYRLVVVSPH